MTVPDFESMTLDELTEWNVAMKARIRALQEQYNQADEHLQRKTHEWHVAEARRQMQILADQSGRTLEEEAEYWQHRLTENNDVGRWVQSNLVLGKPAREGLPQ
jgi:DNA-binding ferritin-like protein (Dps family)